MVYFVSLSLFVYWSGTVNTVGTISDSKCFDAESFVIICRILFMICTFRGLDSYSKLTGGRCAAGVPPTNKDTHQTAVKTYLSRQFF